ALAVLIKRLADDGVVGRGFRRDRRARRRVLLRVARARPFMRGLGRLPKKCRCTAKRSRIKIRRGYSNR
ncbi:MAG: hypothetical protein ACLQM8_16215, partial [Limisphaerales bacterium]